MLLFSRVSEEKLLSLQEINNTSSKLIFLKFYYYVVLTGKSLSKS